MSGRIEIFGAPYARQLRRVGYVPQRESVDWDFLSVPWMWSLWALPPHRLVLARATATPTDCPGSVGTGRHCRIGGRQISQLSVWQQQRTFLARALVQEADLYLMDEPFAAVDAATELAIVDILREINRAGKTVW